MKEDNTTDVHAEDTFYAVITYLLLNWLVWSHTKNMFHFPDELNMAVKYYPV
jgi:hypothetical protein